MIPRFLKNIQSIFQSISIASIDDAWPSRHQTAPCQQVKDVSVELGTLFTRRRELMYQMSILVAVVGGLLQSSAFDGRITHLGLSASAILTLFLGIGSLIFCLRFIQLHFGVLFHGICFALVEAKHQGEENPFESSSVESACKINVRGVSFSVILFFSILSSLCFAVASRAFADWVWFPYFIFPLVFILLMYRTFYGHGRVAEVALEESRNFVASCNCSDDDALHAHYQMSLSATHSDLICVTAIAALQTISIFGFIGLLDEGVVSGLPAPRFGPSIIGAISFLLGLLAVVIYSRLELAVQHFCGLLNLPTSRLFWSAMSDVGLGRLVTVAFAGMNCSCLVFLAFDLFRGGSIDIQTREVVSVLFGLALAVCLLILCSRQVRIANSQKAGA